MVASRCVTAWRTNRLARRCLLVGACAGGLALIASPRLETLGWICGGLLLISAVLLLPGCAGNTRWLSFRLRPQFVLLGISTVLSLLLAEAVLRVCFSPYFVDLSMIWGRGLGYRPDPLLGWFAVPNSRTNFVAQRAFSIAHNSYGFRDPEPKPDQRPRIAFLGDSFVWGYNAEASERFTERLRTLHADWQVLNLGVCGYSTDQEYLLLQKYFDVFHPRVVFLVFCTENDDAGNQWNLCGDWYYKPYYLAGTNGLHLAGVPVPISENVFCVQHSLLSRVYLLRFGLRAWNRLWHPPRKTDPSPTTAILSAIQQFVTRHGAKLGVGLTAPDPALATFLDAANIPWVDLSTNLRVPKDIHWSPEGHAFVAGKIDDWLRKNLDHEN